MKKLLFTFFLLLITSQCFGASQGPLDGGTFTDDGSGDNPWANPGYAVTTNGQAATTLLDFVNGSGRSGNLQATNFGFTIPTGSTILGIVTASTNKSSVSTPVSGASDLNVQLMRGGAGVGNNLATATKYLTTYSSSSYGDAANLWGTTWTPAQINNSSFGVEMSSQVIGVNLVNQTIYYDLVGDITVYYTPPASGGAPKQMSLAPKLIRFGKEDRNPSIRGL